MPEISVVIITLNEEDKIGRCIDSVKDIADEILVVDSFSTDRTEEICLEKGARFIKNKFGGYIEQKNFAKDMAKYPFILSIDADEALSPELMASIREVKASPGFDGYTMNRLNNYCGRWIKHSGWYPDRKLRLFHREKGHWSGVNPHDRIEMNQGVATGHLRGDLLHYSFDSIASHAHQTNNFSGIGAISYYEKGIKAPLIKVVFAPLIRFFRDYILLRGFMDGADGFIICTISSYGVFLKYAKLRAIWKRSRQA